MAQLIEPGNIDLYRQPVIQNPNGGTSTVFSRSYNIDGKEVLLPSVTPDGRFLRTDKEIIDEYKKTGRHLGKFGSGESANQYAAQLHKDYESGKYSQDKNMPFPDYFRNQNWFGGQGRNIDYTQTPQDDDIDPIALYDKMFQPNYAANEAYVRAAQNIPQMQQRSRLDKLGAFLAGLGTGGPAGISEGHLIGYRGNPVEAYNTARGILRGPYDEAVERYKLRLEPLKAQATLEEQRNRDMSARALTLIERINQSRREDRLLRGEGERERHNREVENIRRYSQTHPNYKLIQDEATSEYHFVNPQNPKESPIPTGLYNLTDTEKINLNFAGRMQIEQYRQSEETKRERERETAITGRQENKPEKEELPTQEAQRWRNNAAVAKLNPRYAPFIIGTSPYVTDKPTKGWFESEPDYQKRVQDWLETVAYVHAPRPERKGRTQTRKTTVTMVAPDGTEQEVDPSKVEFYKSRGAKVKQ